MPTVYLDEDTYERVRNLKKQLENTKGGTWFFKDVIRWVLDVLEKEGRLYGR